MKTKTWVSRLLLLLLLVPPIFLRLYNIGSYSLWLDEAITWWRATQPGHTFFRSVAFGRVLPPFFYIAVRAAVGLLLEGEWALRLVSLAASLLTLWVGEKTGEMIAGGPGRVAAILFWGFHPMVLWYTQDAKPYALVLLFSAVCFFLYLRSQQGSLSRMEWILLFICLTLGMVTHYYFLLVVLTLTALIFLDRRMRLQYLRRWFSILLVAMLPLAVWLIWQNSQQDLTLGTGWIAHPSLIDVPLTFWNLASGYAGAFGIATTLFGLVVTAFVIISLIPMSANRLRVRILLVAVLLPVCGIWLLSQYRSIYVDRYFIVLLPFIAYLFILGVGKVWERVCQAGTNKIWCIALFAALFVIGGFAGWQVHGNILYAREDWAGLCHILTRYPDQRILLSDPFLNFPLNYYLGSEIDTEIIDETSRCDIECWWVLRQPYTATHAFTRAVEDPYRPWRPELPPGCETLTVWDEGNGIAAWQIICYPD